MLRVDRLIEEKTWSAPGPCRRCVRTEDRLRPWLPCVLHAQRNSVPATACRRRQVDAAEGHCNGYQVGQRLQAAIHHAKAVVMTQVAKDAGLGRESLYRALRAEGNPSFATVLKVTKAPGMKLRVAATWTLQARHGDAETLDFRMGHLQSKVLRKRQEVPSCMHKRQPILNAPSCKVMVVASTDREWEIRHALESGVGGYLLAGWLRADGASHQRSCGAQRDSLSRRWRGASACREPFGRIGDTARRSCPATGLEWTGEQGHRQVPVDCSGSVKSHGKGVFNKPDVESRTHAVAVAERRGLLCDAPHDARSDALQDARASLVARYRPAAAPGRWVSALAAASRQNAQGQAAVGVH